MTRLGEGFWCLDAPQRFQGVELGTRMSTLRTGDGSLLLYSPVPLTTVTRDQLASLGEVRFIVAPNPYHHLYVAAASRAFPKAVVLAGPGVGRRLQDVPHQRFDPVRSPWGEELRCHVLRGPPGFCELAFFHAPSRTLLLADYVANVRRIHGRWMRIYAWLDQWGDFGVPRQLRLATLRRSALRDDVETVLDWDFDRIVMAHGDVLDSGGQAALRHAFSWLRVDRRRS